METLKKEINACKVCTAHLPLDPRPLWSAHTHCRIVIIGHAPGLTAHNKGMLWADKSGDRLREWLGIGEVTFYDASQIALLPMSFCYPGKGRSGDLPPRKECAPLWHNPVLKEMPQVRLYILIGSYAQQYYLKNKTKKTLTETVKNFRLYLPEYIVLPHPSPRNNIWLSKNPWFSNEMLPEIRSRVQWVLEQNAGKS